LDGQNQTNMKSKLLFSLCTVLFLSIFTTTAQTITCGDLFTDPAGPTTNYDNNADYIETICPTNAGDHVTVTFTSFNTEANWDALYVFDGNSINATQIASTNAGGNVPDGVPGGFWGTTIPGPFTATSTDGCLTFRFRSDTSVNSPGWIAEVSCETPVTCPRPSGIYVNYNNPTNVTLDWTENGTATQWEVLALPSNAAAPTDTTTGTITTTKPYVFTNLTDTFYTFYVRALCSPTENSSWSNPYAFPMPACLTPAVTVSNVSAYSAIVNWATIGTTQYEVLILPAGSPAPLASATGSIVPSPYTVTGLNQTSTYDVYIRTICSASYATDWAAPVSFTTTSYGAPLITGTTNYTSEQLINSVLVNNPCIAISNVTAVTGTNFGSVNGIGYFTNVNPTFPLSSGIILSSGNVLSAPGPNTSNAGEGNNAWVGDPELENIITNATGNVMNSFNATKLEFDFSSLNEFMSFNFLFASEEYGAFQCDYSDAFAFLLTDLETGITTNLAVVPGTTTPVSVVTIRDAANNSVCSSENIGYFAQYNLGGNIYNSATNYNGQTAVMTASSAILPNHNYHIKLVIADRGDSIYDSSVFIEAGSFTSGPPECNDKVQLVAFVDENNNGIKDNNEVNFANGTFVTQQNNVDPTTNITSPFGTYTIYDSTSNTYDFSYTVNSEYSAYYTAAPVTYNDINIAVNPNETLYFPVTLTQGFNDVTVAIVPVNQPRPGFTYTNKIVYTNQGVTATSGTVTFVKSPATSILSIDQPSAVTNADGFTYAFTNLAPYETRAIYVTMSIPEIPTVNLGDVLTDSAAISAPSNDINTSNNTFSNAQVVVASYDPNEVTEAHGGKILFNQFTANDYLYYTIHFQNTGTANAINVRVENVLDARIDPTSIRMISASHDYILERVNNHLVWKFNFINLVGALQNEDLSKGYITFKVKLHPGFAVGDIIPDNASIYFDANPAINTNTFNTQFVTTLNNSTFTSNDIAIYPNPAHNVVQINLQNTSETLTSIKLFDVLGKTINSIENIKANQTTIDVSNLSKGVYLLELTSEHNLKQIKKLIIE
jgi:hypothetical protein